VRTIVINMSLSWYYRADEPLKTVEKMVDLAYNGKTITVSIPVEN